MKRTMALTVLMGAVMMHGSAFAIPQTKGQQKCINALNKSMAKVAGAQNKANAKCANTRAKDGTSDAFSCADNDAKVASAEAKTLEQETNSCTEAPTFGSTSGSNVNNRAQYEAGELGEEVFGSNTGIKNCADDKLACKCQGKALKAANKLYKTHLKTYNKCKKAGLKDKTAAFATDADLATCVGADPKGKIAKAETKLGIAITAKCTGVAIPFAEGECATETGPALTDCLDERVRCHACLTEALSDGLDVDCDVFDDGDDKNGSCFDDF